MYINLMGKIRTLVEDEFDNENYINFLIKEYEKEYDLLGDVLDTIVGYIGNKEMLIEEYFKT
jgi:hypothetical protein